MLGTAKLYAVVCLLLVPFCVYQFSTNNGVVSTNSSEKEVDLPQEGCSDRTLAFNVCNGFTNQRIGLLFGLLLAKQLNRTAVLPDLLQNGVQITGENTLETDAGSSNLQPFGDTYNESSFLQGVREAGLCVLHRREVQPEWEYAALDLPCSFTQPDCLARVIVQLSETPHVRLSGCSFPGIQFSLEDVMAEERAALAVLDGLQLSEHLRDSLQGLLDGFRFLANQWDYNYLHLRLEQDWVKHCARWEDGLLRNNCMSGTFTLGKKLRAQNFSLQLPLYVAVDWPLVDTELYSRAIADVKAAGYHVIRSIDVVNAVNQTREAAAAVDYYLAIGAQKFTGNSVSTFSALQILERRRKGLWASHYNGGSIPLEDFIPLFPLPWVFTHYAESGPAQEALAKGAVESALRVGGLKPFCLMAGARLGAGDGGAGAGFAAWLQSKGVTVVHHSPAWLMDLAYRRTGTPGGYKESLAASPTKLAAAFLRVDVPILPQLAEYEYALYTDADVLFRRRFSLASFPAPLPRTLGMGGDRFGDFPFNAGGVALLNLPELSATHAEFTAFLTDGTRGGAEGSGGGGGLHFPGFGSLALGALNQFYEQTVRIYRLPTTFNAKAYHAFEPTAFIVHFQGPKLADFETFLESGECGYDDLCEIGLASSLCRYFGEYQQAYNASRALYEHLAKACDGEVLRSYY